MAAFRWVTRLAILSLFLSLAWAAAPPQASDPVVGNPKAAVRVVVYQDLECPSCAAWHKTLTTDIIPAFQTRVAFEFRDFPLPQHLWSYNAAVIARYFDSKNPKLGLDWRDYCFTHQDSLTPETLIGAAAGFGASAGVTRNELTSVFSRADLLAEINADKQKGTLDHVDHTPYIMVNGAVLKGDNPTPDDLRAAINLALAH